MMYKPKPKVVVIAGPTASGKTSVSVQIALDLNGEIVNADSMQVYRGMDIGTAKPTASEQRGVPHHLLDVVDPDEDFNAAIYGAMALDAVDDIEAKGRLCLVVGGTGLYIKSLLGGLFSCPPADRALRLALRRECETAGAGRLHERLTHLDPESAERIHPNDHVRITRALEIAHLTRKRPSALAQGHAFTNSRFDALKFCLDVDREQLYSRINERSIAMVETGLTDETEYLLKKGYSPELKPMKAIGYRHMVNYLSGVWSLQEAVHHLQRDTRRYAKRQLTWFRSDPDMIWISPGQSDRFKQKIIEFILDDEP